MYVFDISLSMHETVTYIVPAVAQYLCKYKESNEMTEGDRTRAHTEFVRLVRAFVRSIHLIR